MVYYSLCPMLTVKENTRQENIKTEKETEEMKACACAVVFLITFMMLRHKFLYTQLPWQ